MTNLVREEQCGGDRTGREPDGIAVRKRDGREREIVRWEQKPEENEQVRERWMREVERRSNFLTRRLVAA